VVVVRGTGAWFPTCPVAGAGFGAGVGAGADDVQLWKKGLAHAGNRRPVQKAQPWFLLQ